MSDKYDWKTIRPAKYGDGFDVHGFKPYPRNSVLAGQMAKCWIDTYPTYEEAKAAHPEAEGGSSYTDPQVTLNHLPSEDDMVPGGAYPDDWED